MQYYTSTTEYNCGKCGIDLHAHQMYVCVMDRQGKKPAHCNIKDINFEYFLKLVQPYRHSLTICASAPNACLGGTGWPMPARKPV